MKKLLFILLLSISFYSCLPVLYNSSGGLHLKRPTKLKMMPAPIPVANVDSLMEVVFSLPDLDEREYAVIWVDSLANKFFPDSIKTSGRTVRANWIDNERIRKGAKTSKLVKFLSFEQKFYTVFFSETDLSAVTERICYQEVDSAFKRIFAADSTVFEGFKFSNRGELTTFINDFESRYIRQVKVAHNTTYHASAFTTSGDDADDGTTWALAVLTLGRINALNPTGNDSVLLNGTFTETWSPDDDGTSGNQIMVYDSLSGTNGMNFTNPDTANIWSAIIDPTTDGIVLNGDDFWRFHGIRITSMSVSGVTFSTGATDNAFVQMRFDSHADGSGSFIAFVSGSSNRVSVISCVFMESSGATRSIDVADTGGSIFINNSIRGTFTGTLVDQDDTDGPTIWINNAFDQKSTVAGDRVFGMDDPTPTTNMEFNNNMFNKGEDNNFRFNAAVFNLISVWEDSTNNYLAGNSDNSVDDDPEFQGITTTLFIDTDSPAFGTGVARGGFQDASNPSIGWYQPVSAAVRSRFIPVF